ncbi:MAG TPA: kelch repeat-containing protein [Planctomycetota bacterium]|nr:kelch repeat-containing protein [Planctomycetota bacterium]
MRSFVALLCVAPVAAQWQRVPALNAPPHREGFTLTPMPNGELLLFGGDITNPAATEWAWNGVEWRQVTTPVPRRQYHAMGVDDSTGNLVLFGGQGPAGALSDTWTFDGTTWTQLVTAAAPPLLIRTSMAFDPVDHSMVLVGEPFSPGQLQTWRLFGGNWSLLPGGVFPATAAYVYHDTVRGEAALFTADTASGVNAYRLEAGVWVQTGHGPTLPIATTTMLAAFDRDRARLVAFAPQLFANTTYEWDGLFGQLLVTATPTFSLAPVMAYHPARAETVFVESSSPMSVWRWAPHAVPQATPFGAPCQDPTFELGLAPGDSPQPGASHRLLAQGQNGSFLSLSLIGLSYTAAFGQPLPFAIPIGTLGCQLRVDPLIVSLLGAGLPATQLVTFPNSPSLLGMSYDAQCAQLDGSGVLDTSNGLEVQIGLPLPEQTLTETFTSGLQRDPAASGDLWTGGNVQPVALGGDGRHGSFDAAFGQLVQPGVYEWNTDNQLIPASATLSGKAEFVSDGRFYFTDLTVPAGVEVRFVGYAPAEIHVRGRVEIDGVLRADAASMPYWVPTIGLAIGQRVSSFDARGGIAMTVQVDGQQGGVGGCGGGRGGKGGKECAGAGPEFVIGIPVNDGQAGQNVTVPAGHAYAGSAGGTGGRGSVMTPSTGMLPVSPPLSGSIYRALFSPGGAGGGYNGPGGASTATPLPTTTVGIPMLIGPAPAVGQAFPIPLPSPLPPNYTSLNHFLIGGSGGGGGGSHMFSTQQFIQNAQGQLFVAGSGGTGGGGAVAVRAGGDLVVSNGGTASATGGAGVLINGDSPTNISPGDIDYGVSSPGGGGSGGSLLLQSSANVTVAGTVDCSGGLGSRTGMITPSTINIVSQAGNGAPGFYRLEAAGGVTFSGAGQPAYNASQNAGLLTDSDSRTGSRSLWLLPPTNALPVYLRYELVADVAGATVLFSDDASVSSLAADNPNGPVFVRFQGAQRDPATGNALPSTIGPWRTRVATGGGDSLNHDRATLLRFDLVVDKGFGPVVVRELRVYWR